MSKRYHIEQTASEESAAAEAEYTRELLRAIAEYASGLRTVLEKFQQMHEPPNRPH